LILTLIVAGALLLVAEMVLLPGLTVAGVGALAAYGVAIYFGFDRFGTRIGFLVVGIVVVISILMIVISLSARTWRRLSLGARVDGVSQSSPDRELARGDRGVTATRLAPMGKVMVGEQMYEAKSLGDTYIDQQTEVEVVGFENFSVIVKKTAN
jgi:membrane-bound ClpP family serine protease